MNSTVRVVLVRPRDPNNIGAVARAMKNFGFGDLCVVSPYALTWDEVTAAPNAMDVVTQARIVATLDEAVADCNLVVGTGDQTRTTGSYTPRDLSNQLHAASYRVALVFGNEKHGLTNEDFSRCHRVMEIPTQPGCPSMNLGQAVAVCLYELVREEIPDTTLAEQAGAGVTNAAVALAMEVLQQADFVLPGNADDLMRRVRAALHKYQLSQYDTTMLCGILRKIKDNFQEKHEQSKRT
jgi:tRNA/rRNA methyltransferase